MMILKDRVLFLDGISLVPDDVAMKKIKEIGYIPKHFKVQQSRDSEEYDRINGTSVTYASCFEKIDPEYITNTKLPELVDFLYKNKRDDTDDITHKSRLDTELYFFASHKKTEFLCNIKDFIDKLRADDVVWGGRGSSCASYVLYLIGVHAINPIKFDINFSEFSKEE